MALATSYWGAGALLGALEIGVFDALAAGPAKATTLAEKLGTAPRPTRLLLNALCALDLLERDAERYALSGHAVIFLDPSSPAYLGDALRYATDMYQAWGELGTALRENRPVVANVDYLGEDRERTRRFVRGMHSRAMAVGQALVHLVDLEDARSLLDLGGGPGTYSALFTRRHPQLAATVIELPGVAAVASEILTEMGAAEQVRVLGGDIHDIDFPANNDAVLISGVLHREDDVDAKRLLCRAAAALAPGGRLVVSDVFTDDGGASPEFATLFGLNMLLSAPGGGVHADTDVASWMRDAGVGDVTITPFPPPMPHRVLVGRVAT